MESRSDRVRKFLELVRRMNAVHPHGDRDVYPQTTVPGVRAGEPVIPVEDGSTAGLIIQAAIKPGIITTE